MRKPGLSVCMIVKNEESNLAQCLDSVKDIAAEIIIVDTGSTDNSIKIAQNYKANIIHYQWDDDFSAARNISLEAAKQPYILIIDADERLMNPLVVDSIIRNADDKTGLWLVNVVSNAAKPDGTEESYTANLPRLFLNSERFKFEGIIHEQVTSSVIKAGFGIKPTNIVIKHSGYSISPDRLKQKFERNLKLINKALISENENTYLLYQKGRTLMSLNRLKESEDCFSTVLEKGMDRPDILPMALNWSASLALKMNDPALAEKRAKAALNIVPDQSYSWFILGEVYFMAQKFDDAYLSYGIMEKSLDKFPTARVDIFRTSPEMIAFKKGKCLLKLGKYLDAVKEFERGITINKKYIHNLVGLANVSLILKKFNQARNFLGKALEIEPANREILSFLEVVNRQSGLKISKSGKEMPQEGNVKKDKSLISLSMIVKNEEEMLPDCLESVKEIVDEMIIVDTGSTDKTIEIAKSYGANVIEMEWENDFSKARNESLKNCTGDWILYLDADERLGGESKDKIRYMLENATEDTGAFICTIESEHLQVDGRYNLHRGGYPRLFRNYGYPVIKFSGKVHEQITPSINDVGGKFLTSDIVIEHLGYKVSREVMEAKVKRNYKLLMEHVKADPLNGYAWFQIGQTLAQMALFKEAEEAIKFALQSGNLSKSVYASAASTLSQMLGSKKQFSDALHWAEESLKTVPDQIYALNLRAFSLVYLGRFEEAETDFRQVLKKMDEKKGVPMTAYDVGLDKNIVNKGLEWAINKKVI